MAILTYAEYLTYPTGVTVSQQDFAALDFWAETAVNSYLGKGILYRVVSIHIEIALAAYLHVDPGMPGQSRQHVIEKSYSGIDLIFTLAVEIDLYRDIGLFGASLDFSCSGHLRSPP